MTAGSEMTGVDLPFAVHGIETTLTFEEEIPLSYVVS